MIEGSDPVPVLDPDPELDPYPLSDYWIRIREAQIHVVPEQWL
jgi:hypothetical protein